MTTPRRFTDCPHLFAEGRLLVAGRAEYPEHAALQRAALRLGLPAVAVGSAAATASVTATSATSTAAAHTTSASIATTSTTLVGATSTLLTTTFLKATVIGVVIGAGTLGSADLARRSTAPKPATISVATAVRAPQEHSLQAPQTHQEAALPVTPSASKPTELPRADESPAVSATSESLRRRGEQATIDAIRQSSKVSPSSASVNDALAVASADFDNPLRGVTSPPNPKTHLASEVESLDRARAAASRGDAAGALRELDDFASHHPYRLLVGEVMLVRIDALLALGHRKEAATLARQLLQLGAPAPQRTRLERLARME